MLESNNNEEYGEITPKEEKEIEKLISYLNSYKRVLIVSSEDVPTPELQKLRPKLRDHNITIIKPKNVFQLHSQRSLIL